MPLPGLSRIFTISNDSKSELKHLNLSEITTKHRSPRLAFTVRKIRTAFISFNASNHAFGRSDSSGLYIVIKVKN
jgi:hypothetical protein